MNRSSISFAHAVLRSRSVFSPSNNLDDMQVYSIREVKECLRWFFKMISQGRVDRQIKSNMGLLIKKKTSANELPRSVGGVWPQVTDYKLKALYHEGLGSKTPPFITMQHDWYRRCQIATPKLVVHWVVAVNFPVYVPEPSKQLSPWIHFPQCEAPQNDLGIGSQKGVNPTLHWQCWPIHLNHPYFRFPKLDGCFDWNYFYGQRHPSFMNASAKVPICVLLGLPRWCYAT